MKLLDKQLSEKIEIDEAEGLTRMRFMFLMANRKTQNGNLYSPDVLKAAAGEFAEKVKRFGPAFGSPGHVKDMELTDVSHMIEAINYDDNKQGLVATIKLLPNAKAKNIKAIIANGGRVGVSARGEGQRESDGTISRYSIKGADFTLSPSTGIDVGSEAIFESADLNEEMMFLAECRYQAAVRGANYLGTFGQYFHDVFQPLVERQKEEAKRLEETQASNTEDNGLTTEELNTINEALTVGLAEKFPGLVLESFNGDFTYCFSPSESVWYQIPFAVDEESGLRLGRKEPMVWRKK